MKTVDFKHKWKNIWIQAKIHPTLQINISKQFLKFTAATLESNKQYTQMLISSARKYDLSIKGFLYQ